ncbi:AAA family ATPase [Paenibacillus athensensis]|uniref:Cell division protein n=1 Tax=Paenibacillus athensensis TaxID=1967502 RepID=A0A4Y8Q780_9BACL|nr:AAA family ATPase [Paenibacillus athensensis]MCD1257322.1 AAA family ATPase [Paenibacillus athensensis]
MNRLQWLRQVTEWHPDQAEGWYWLGQAYIESEEYVAAIVALTEGLKLASPEQKPLFLDLLAAAAQPAAPQPPKAPQEQTTEQPLEPAAPAAPQTETEASPAAARSDRSPMFKVISGQKDDAAASRKRAQEDVISFADVAGLTDLKKTIRMKIVSPFYNQGLFSKFRKKAGGGVLLYGPPGCGKTFMAKATAGECRAKFIPIHITDILDPYIGVSERNLHELFAKARSQKPSIVFIDELDAIGYDRAKSSSNFRGLVDTFLTEMEGIDSSTDQVLVIGATNMPWDVDNALKRPGRFDRMIFVAPPDEEARRMIFELKLKDRLHQGIDFASLAKRSEFFSGADIENVCERAVENVLEDILESGIERPIAMRDMEQALESITASTLEWLKTAKNYVRYANQSGLYNDIEAYLRVYGRKL